MTILAESTRFPNPIGDTVAVQKDKSIRINVLANDVFRGSEGTISQFNDWSEKGGQIKMDENSELIYTPPSGFTGTDTFWYAIKDSVEVTGQPIEHATKVTIDVSDANQAGPYPVAQEDFVDASSSCNPRGACARNLNRYFVTTNDTGKNLKISSGSAFSMNGGSVTIVSGAPSLFTYIYYVPGVRAIDLGSDKIWYVIEDEVGRKNWSVVNITVLE